MKVCPLCNAQVESGDTCPADGAILIPLGGPKDPLIGTTLKDVYKITEKISTGGMGAIYRGTQMPLGRTVAIKTILPNLQAEPDAIQRFYREAKLLSKVSHPNIVSIIDFGNTESGMLYMVMEFLEGKTIKDAVPKDTGLPLPEIVQYMSDICSGIGAAHQNHLVHRDLKPGNILLAEIAGGRKIAKILDFGIARALNEDVTRLTARNVAAGTPGFLAPEQYENAAAADERSDIYSLGALLYYLIGGKEPFSGTTSHTILYRQMQKDPERLDFEALGKPRALEKVYLKAMAHQPDMRYRTAGEFLQAIHEAAGVTPFGTAAFQGPLVPAPPKRRILRRVAIAGAAALALAALVFVFLPKEPEGSPDPGEEAGGNPGKGHQFRGIDDEKVLFGMSAAFSGTARDLGEEMERGILTCFHHVNAAGGVYGRKLKLISLDDGYEPDRALANVKELLAERGVFALIGNVGTPTAKVTAPFCVEKQFLLFAPFTGAGLLRKDPPDRYVFNYRASYDDETRMIVKYLLKIRKVPADTIAVFAQDDSYGEAGFQGVSRALRDASGIEPNDIPRFGYERNSEDVKDAVDGTWEQRDRIKAVVIIGAYAASAKYIHSLKAKGMDGALFVNVSFVGSLALADCFKQRYTPGASKGVIVTQVVPFFKSNSTGVRKYKEHLQKYFPRARPSFVSLEGYISASILAHALQRTGPKPTTDTLVDTLEGIRDLDLGFGAPITFGPSRHQGSSKVWGTVLDENAEYQELRLD